MPSRERSFDHPSPRRHGTRASPTPITTTPQMENALAAQATMMVPLRTAAPWLETSLPFECHHARHRGQLVQAHARQPTTEQEAAPWRS
jgi:hypothetical protein